MTQTEATRQLVKCMDLADVVDLDADEGEAILKARIIVNELERRGIRLVSAGEAALPPCVTAAILHAAPMVRETARFEDGEDGA